MQTISHYVFEYELEGGEILISTLPSAAGPRQAKNKLVQAREDGKKVKLFKVTYRLVEEERIEIYND